MVALARSRTLRVAVALVAVAMGGIGFIPLFDGPGYESSLAGGILLAFVTSVTAALVVASPDRVEDAPRELFATGVSIGAALALTAWLTTIAHGLRVGFCDALGGSEIFALGPGAGALLAGTWGAIAGEIARRRRRRRLVAVLIAVAGPLGSILFSVGRFYTSPMIFAYDPFVGFFSGTLYDTLIDFSGLLSYRAGSAATLFAAFVFAEHLERSGGRLRLAAISRPGLAVAGSLAAIASLGANAFGSKLGHWQTSGTIAAALGGRVEGERCTVVYARTQRLDEVERFAKDCDAHVAVLERWFGAPGPARITAFLFESSAQKGALMGAADTYIAKPWRKEIYLQVAAYPHPVLGHELAHVIAGAFGRGPFRVAGSVGGLLPDPGLIEGVAVAAEPPEGELLPREWARTMKDTGLLPKLDRLFTLGFLGQNAGVAYTVSGAFVGWVHDRFGPGVVTAWYGGRLLPDIVGIPWAELEAQWRADLGGEVVPGTARGVAKARFSKPGVFGRRCPHMVDGCRARGEHLRNTGDLDGAIAAFEELLTLDPHDDAVRDAIARIQLRQRDREGEGVTTLTSIAEDTDVARHVRDRATEDLADLALVRGHGEEATKSYADVLSRTLDEDAKRTLEIKIAAASDASLRPAIVALLIGAHGRGPDRAMAMELLGADTATRTNDGLPEYLLARQYLVNGLYGEATARLDRALALPFRLPRVRLEAERLRMLTACALGDAPSARKFFAVYSGHPEVNTARRGAARALVERCTLAP